MFNKHHRYRMIERGEYGQPEIQGYTKGYLQASSPRRERVKDHLRAEGLEGAAAAAQIAAHRTRDRKEQLSPEEVQRQHRELAAQYGNQAEGVVAAAQKAVTYARDHLFERTAVESERSILTAALDRAWARRRSPRCGRSLIAGCRRHAFVGRLHPNDRVLLVGDTRQHESVEAGRIFAQMQEGACARSSSPRSCARKTPR